MTRQPIPATDETQHALSATPAFFLLFSVQLKGSFSGFGADYPGVTSGPIVQTQEYLDQFADLETRLLGESFHSAHRISRWPLGRISLADARDAVPVHADVFLLVHKSGVALWEIWIPAAEQNFDASRWIAWLDPSDDSSLVTRLWRVLSPINLAITGAPKWSGTYFPITVLRLPNARLATVLARHGPELVRLLYLNSAHWTLKPDVVRKELERDYCAREGGITLFARRSGIDLHAQESLAAEEEVSGIPPRTTLPFVITLEMLLLERVVLQRLYDRILLGMPRSVAELLLLKREMLDALQEYHGGITSATRFSDAISIEGERLLGIDELYEAVMNRLETVSFEITTRYQQRTTSLQFWLTIVFGATEIGFIASGIASWYYQTELLAVLAWTAGTAVATGVGLAALLRGKLG
jgi:hypothetical protein